MIDPDDFMLVKFDWSLLPTETERTTKAALVSARRVLLAHAPAELEGTGMHLLPRDAYEAFKTDMEEALEGESISAEDVLVMFPAPAIDEWTEPLYENTVRIARKDLSDELLRVATKVVTDQRVTARLTNAASVALEKLCLVWPGDETDQLRGYLDKLALVKHGNDRAKGEKMFKALARKVTA